MDPELDNLIRDETLERSVRVTRRLATLAEQLAQSLQNAAEGFDRLAVASADPGSRRSEFRRLECPGRFD